MTLDPDIERFARRMLAGVAPASDGPVDVEAARRAASMLRLPWNEGGPAMHRRFDAVIEGPQGAVPVRLYQGGPEPVPPVLVYLHGGGWTLLSIDTHDRIMREFAAASGWAVLGIDYPLAPEHPFPAAIEACLAVLAELPRRAEAWKIDAGTVALVGDSSGANLALAATLALRDAGAHLPAALVLAYGAFDGLSDSASRAQFGKGDLPLSAERIEWFWSNYCSRSDDRLNPRASPLRADLHGLPPIRLIAADHDVLLDENLDLYRGLSAAGGAASLAVYPGTTHAFLEAVSTAAVARRAIDDAARWLSGLRRAA